MQKSAAMDQQAPRYSTLELYTDVSPGTRSSTAAPHDPANAPEVYFPPQPDSSLPQPVNGYYPVKGQAPPLELDAVVKNEFNADGTTTKLDAVVNTGAVTARKRICGLTPRLFTIIAVIAGIIVVGAAVGGAVGATVGKKNSNNEALAPPGNTTSSSPNATTSNVMDGSRVGAIVWEDSHGNTISSIFFQDTTKGLGLSQYNSSTKEWIARSVSDDLYNTTSQSVTPSKGTPLVPLCLGWVEDSVKIELYFLSASTTPTSIYSQVEEATGWHQDQLASAWTGHPLSSGSHLAVYEDYCPDGCTNQTYTVGEGDSHDFVTFARASPTANTWAYSQFLLGLSPPSPINLFQNSSIAYTRPHGGGTVTRDGLRMYVDVGGMLNEYMFANATWNLRKYCKSLARQEACSLTTL